MGCYWLLKSSAVILSFTVFDGNSSLTQGNNEIGFVISGLTSPFCVEARAAAKFGSCNLLSENFDDLGGPCGIGEFLEHDLLSDFWLELTEKVSVQVIGCVHRDRWSGA